jgi:hypothetical protein
MVVNSRRAPANTPRTSCRLEEAGLAERALHKGAAVERLTLAGLEQVYDVWILLESVAASLGPPSWSDELCAILQLCDEMARAVERRSDRPRPEPQRSPDNPLLRRKQPCPSGEHPQSAAAMSPLQDCWRGVLWSRRAAGCGRSSLDRRRSTRSQKSRLPQSPASHCSVQSSDREDAKPAGCDGRRPHRRSHGCIVGSSMTGARMYRIAQYVRDRYYGCQEICAPRATC